jgi:hypothetical protein
MGLIRLGKATVLNQPKVLPVSLGTTVEPLLTHTPSVATGGYGLYGSMDFQEVNRNRYQKSKEIRKKITAHSRCNLQ